MLATAYLANGDGESALAHSRKGVAADPSPQSRATLGGVLLALQRHADAAAVLRQVASARIPRASRSSSSLGIASAQAGDYGEAIQAYARALEARIPAIRDRSSTSCRCSPTSASGSARRSRRSRCLASASNQPGEVSVLFDLATIHIYTNIAARLPAARPSAKDPDEAVDKR